MSRVLRTAVVLAAGICLGCGDGGKPAEGPADPGPMTVVEDAAGGFRLAVPRDWERMLFPPRSQENRRFAGAWGPQGVTLPQEGLLVQVMAPGCVASDFGARVSGELMATTREAKGYSVLSSGPAMVGARPAFRLDAKFGSELGDLVEAAAYVETSPGAGVYVASRGPVGTEAMVRARLDRALAAFESIPRVVQAGAASKRAWGVAFGLPGGFEEFTGSQIPPAVAGYWVGASANNADKQAAMEAVTLILLPDVSGAAEMIRNAMAASTRGRKEGARKKFRTKSGQEIESASFGPEKPDQPRYETAVGGFRTKDGYAALAVNAAIAPEGRALAILETIISTLVVEDTPTPKVEGKAFGEGNFRWGAVPAGWDLQVTDDSLGALLNEKMTDVPPGAPDTRARMGANTSFGEDRFGDDTPASLALWYYRRVDRKKASPLPPESFALADGREAARMVVVVPGRTEVIAFARCGPAAMAEVHVSAISEDSPLAVRVATELVAAARLLPLQD
ncbi:MAG: hypothetical protein HUU15_11680, partial [Candidatus Brocadiae bacterium]|nr:hypothetical protein [Candidatus Brocadiia bacterium]